MTDSNIALHSCLIVEEKYCVCAQSVMNQQLNKACRLKSTFNGSIRLLVYFFDVDTNKHCVM